MQLITSFNIYQYGSALCSVPINEKEKLNPFRRGRETTRKGKMLQAPILTYHLT
jgi:hypothetical protein